MAPVATEPYRRPTRKEEEVASITHVQASLLQTHNYIIRRRRPCIIFSITPTTVIINSTSKNTNIQEEKSKTLVIVRSTPKIKLQVTYYELPIHEKSNALEMLLNPTDQIAIPVRTPMIGEWGNETYKTRADCVFKYISMQGHPCKILEKSTTRTIRGKKCHFVGMDIHTGRKYERTFRDVSMVTVPIVTRREILYAGYDEGGLLLKLKGVLTRAYPIAKGDASEGIRKFVPTTVGDPKHVVFSVLFAMGKEAAVTCKEVEYNYGEWFYMLKW